MIIRCCALMKIFELESWRSLIKNTLRSGKLTSVIYFSKIMTTILNTHKVCFYLVSLLYNKSYLKIFIIVSIWSERMVSERLFDYVEKQLMHSFWEQKS